MSYTNGLDKPTDYFNTVLYTGNATARDITTGLETTDFIWNKRRDSTGSHLLYDKVRGVNKDLNSESTEAEETQVGTVTAFGTDSFSLGTHGGTNGSGESKVTWCWSAGGTTGSSNTDGSITSTVSANTTSGFSIVSYTGSATNPSTVGHGLGTAPAMIIVKNRSTSGRDWVIWHKSLGGASSTADLLLFTTDAKITSSGYWGSSAPSSTTFGVGNTNNNNANGDNHIAYCFAEKKGFSKFGSYTGNGSTDGTFVYLGFKPAWTIIKRSNNTSDGWYIHDSTRKPFNENDNALKANSNSAESGEKIDYVSNGFKHRIGANGNFNGSGDTYIYMAFAENPFVTSTGIPTTAR